MMPPELADVAERLAAADVDWSSWRACPVCRAELGAACRALSGRVAGTPTGSADVPLPRPHAARKRRTGR